VTLRGQCFRGDYVVVDELVLVIDRRLHGIWVAFKLHLFTEPPFFQKRSVIIGNLSIGYGALHLQSENRFQTLRRITMWRSTVF